MDSNSLAPAVQHIAVGDLSVGHRMFGPQAARGATSTPLLLIMGSSATMDLWPKALVDGLASDRQVIVFDNRGIGETDDPLGAYPFSQLADDTAALISALGYESVDVLGWSMGGMAAIDLAVRHPQSVRRLISYAGDAGGAFAVPPSPEVIAQVTDTSGSPQEHGQRLLELLFSDAYRAAHPDYLRNFPVPTERAAAAAIGLQARAIGGWEGVADGLASITCPTLFITGTEDVLAPPANAEKMAAVVAGSWLVRIAGAGHGLMYQDPEGLARIVGVFLDSATDA